MSEYSNLELLAPAGDFERLQAALLFGADAVYLGAKSFGMRASPSNFTFEELEKACKYAHSLGKKIHLTCNTLPKNDEVDGFEDFIKQVYSCGIDAAIVNDIGLFSLIKKYVPDLELHVSTQAGVVNYATANAFYNMGAKRVVLARELSIDDISEIRAKTPKELDIECFVHGAMCVSFSGRCLLSQYLINRDANRGECAQPCRWKYYLMEEKRPGEYYPISEDEKGSYILNAKDMCMIEHIDKLAEAGVKSFKIEGRAKSAYYVSVVTNAYRHAIDIFKKNPERYELPQWIKDEVYKVSHREYCNGFYFGNPKVSQYYETSGYVRNYDVVAVVDDCKDGYLYCTQRNRFFRGDELEILSPDREPVRYIADEIINEAGESVDVANIATMKLCLLCQEVFQKGTIIRKKLN